MAISLQRYVNITSSVGSGTVVPTRLLVARMITGNNLLPPETFIQFSNAADVGTYFGTTSEEYYRAVFYFEWISKNNTSAPALQFARWVNANSYPQIYSAPQTQSLANWQAVTAGAFILTIGGVQNTVSGLNFSSVTSYSDIAGIIQDAIIALYSTQDDGTLNSTITVTGLADTSGLAVGMRVQGTGIQNGTTIASIVNGTSITLSLAATITGTSTLTFSLSADAQYVDSSVVFSGNSFIFTGGVTGVATISVQSPVSGQDISGVDYLGWSPKEVYPNGIFSQTIFDNTATWVDGAVAETITFMLNATQAASNNFGSFLFLNDLGINLTQAQEAAAWNAAAAQNNMYLYSVPVVPSNVSSWAAGLASYAGTTLTVNAAPFNLTGTLLTSSVEVTALSVSTDVLEIGMPVSGTGIPDGAVVASIVDSSTFKLSEAATATGAQTLTFSTVQFPEQCPVMIEAATNYGGNNAVQNYMYQVFDPYLTPTVRDDSTASSYDALSVNYYGQTQTAGTQFNFYQRGLMMGTSSSPLDQNTYVNEIWLKDSIAAILLALQLNLNQLAANAQGRSLVLLQIQQVINQAVNNGVISVGKTLTNSQIVYIGSVTNDPEAWYQVQNSGYWVDCIVQPIPNVTPVQYEAAYTLVYSKDDVIRYITGADILI